MDGGKKSNSGKEEAHEMIAKSLLSIEGILSKVKGYKADWTFQSWVVTHWDQDHYAGVVDFFKIQRKAFPIANSGKGKPVSSKKGNSTIKTESTKNKPNTASLSGSPKLGEIRSYFADTVTLMCGARPPDEKSDYLLLESLEGMSDYGLKLKAKNMGRSLIGVDLFSDKLVLPPPEEYEEVVVTPRKKKQAKNLEMEEEKENSVTPRKKKQAKNLEMEEEKDNSVTPKQVRSTEESQISAIQMKPATPEVRREKIILKIETNTKRTMNVSAVERPVFVVIGAEGFSLANSTRDKIPSKNETSILALVYWRAKKRASYFTGGDGNPEVERKVLNHLKERKLIENVKTMKLDHHGSSGENLATWHTEKGRKNTAPVLDIIKPECVLVTPGDQYEHPCWDVLFYLFHYIDGRKLEKGALWTTRTPYWMNQLKYWGNIINIKKNERLQNVHEARAAIEEGLFSVLDCFGDLQDFIKDRINSAKAKKLLDQKTSIETVEKSKTSKLAKKLESKELKSKELKSKELKSKELKSKERKPKFFYKVIKKGDFMELGEAGSESEPEDTLNDQDYAKEREKELIYALKELWNSACVQELPKKANVGNFYLVWFACKEEPSEDCIFHAELIAQCTLNTKNNNWNSGARRKQSSRRQTSRSVPLTGVLPNTPLMSTEKRQLPFRGKYKVVKALKK